MSYVYKYVYCNYTIGTYMYILCACSVHVRMRVSLHGMYIVGRNTSSTRMGEETL